MEELGGWTRYRVEAAIINDCGASGAEETMTHHGVRATQPSSIPCSSSMAAGTVRAGAAA